MLLAVLACAACADSSVTPDAGACRIPLPIADPDRFVFTPEAEDPFRPMGLDASVSSTTTRGRCGPLDVKAEDLGGSRSFSITTLFCSWGTAETRALAAIAEGDPLKVRIWHFSHIKIQNAEARIVIAVEGRTLWETRVPLPTEGALLVDDFPAPFAIAKDAKILWHVANHGQNSWNFLTLESSTEGECPARSD